MTNDRPGWVPDDLFPFRSRYMDIDGCQVHYVDEGEGPTLLFLHGNPTWSFLYRNLVAGLRSSFRCVALDYPGFGLSRSRPGYGWTPAEHAAIVERFVLELDLTEITLMGQDWGGPIGLTVATRHPARFSGLVLGNTWAWPLNRTFHFEAFARLMGSAFMRFWIRNANAFVNVMIPLGTRSRLSPEVMRAYRGPFPDRDSRRPTWVFPRELLRSEPFLRRLEADLENISHLPALFVWGAADFALRKGVELPRFKALFPTHETVLIERARHFFQEDAPKEVQIAIADWMQRTAASADAPR